MEFLEKECQNEENSSKIVCWDKKKNREFQNEIRFCAVKTRDFLTSIWNFINWCPDERPKFCEQSE